MAKKKKIKSDYFIETEGGKQPIAVHETKIVPSAIDQRFMSAEERKEIAEKRVKTIMERKTFEQLVKEVGEENLPDELKASIYYSNTEEVNFQKGAIRGMYVAAVNGSSKAATFLRDTAGEKPVEKVEVKTDLSDEEKLRLIEAERARFTEENE